MAPVHSWQNNPDVRSVLLQALEALSAGRLVVFPTDTGYALSASARHAAAVERLMAHCTRRPTPLGSPPLSLAVAGVDHALEFLPELGPASRRLARRCWPGPVTLLQAETKRRNGDEVSALSWECTRTEGCQALRSPAHAAILTALQQLPEPLVLGALHPAADAARLADGTAAGEALAELGEALALVIDDGPCLYPDGATVVRVEGDSWQVVREGVVRADQIQMQVSTVIVFVCTGNTCRSPLAEVLCRKRLAERLGCTPEELPGRGFLVLSAGLAAYDGEPAAGPALEVARGHGLDLSAHQSRTLDRELAYQADYLVCMTANHLQALEESFPHLSCKPRLLNPEGQDLADPIGQEESVYRACAERIWQDLEALVRELCP